MEYVVPIRVIEWKP